MRAIMRRLAAVCSAAALTAVLAAALPACADTVPSTFSDDAMTYEFIEGGIRVTAADTGLVTLNIPKSIGDYPIISLGKYAFSECGGLREVTVDAELDEIETGAFSGCAALEKVTFSRDVKKIADGAFYNCAVLKTVTLPDSVAEIGNYAFSGCVSMREFDLPAGVKELPAYCFYYDAALEHVTLHEGLETINGMAFVRCDALKDIEIPASLTGISAYAFISCSGLTRITLAEGNTAYQTDSSGVLYNAAGDVLMLYPAAKEDTAYTAADGVTLIAPYAFSGAANLQEITLPESVTELGEGAFSGCKGLTQFTLPQNIKTIAGTLFAETGLKSFVIPEGVTEIGEYAFYRCAGLSQVRIPSGVTSVGTAAFFNCTSLSEVELPDSVTEIGENAFGFRLDPNAADGESIIQQEDFVLRGNANSAAKSYAAENSIRFKTNGLNSAALLIAVIAVLVLLFAAVTVIALRRRKTAQPAGDSVPKPEEEFDTDYTSILADTEDAGDPYERFDNSTPLSGEERQKLDTETFPDD